MEANSNNKHLLLQAIVRMLIKVGLDQQQAEEESKNLQAALEERMLTKEDLFELEHRLGMKLEALRIDEQFEKIDDVFEKIDQRFDKIDERFDKVDERFEKIDQRFQKLANEINDLKIDFERRFNELDKRIIKLDAKVDMLDQKQEAGFKHIDQSLTGLKNDLLVKLSIAAGGIIAASMGLIALVRFV